jgi:hypothetical protein
MNKPDLIDKIKDLQLQIKKLKINELFLIKQKRELIKLAEEQGNKKAQYKHNLIRAEEKIERLNNKLLRYKK